MGTRTGRLAALLAGIVALAGVTTDAGAVETASLRTGDTGEAAAPQAPRVLAPDTAERYRRIFALQKDGRWEAADRLIADLDNDLLLGHVLAQRYLHPTDYWSSFPELRDWLAAYPSHPQARRLYRLAVDRRGDHAWPPQPEPVRVKGDGPRPAADEAPSRPRLAADAPPPLPPARLTAKERDAAADLEASIRTLIRRRDTLIAKRLLREDGHERLLGPNLYDRLRGRLAGAYFVDGYIDLAWKWGRAAAERSGPRVPRAQWYAGLAAWRLDKHAAARRHFEAAAESAYADAARRAAAAFWAARANLVTRRPEAVTGWLEKEADRRRDFYGLLARRALGLDPGLDWNDDAAGASATARVRAHPAGRRALALAQVGRRGTAARELRRLARAGSERMAEAALAIAGRAGLPSLALRMARLTRQHYGRRHESAAYPVPPWRPEDGWDVDRALLYAFMRKESGFQPRARSHVGATGLMQLMPATAIYISGRRDISRADLYDPAFNMALGQDYISYLLDSDPVNGDLMRLAAAYNGGPGNLQSWLRIADHPDDPLLFIESIPSRETRVFVERVLSNLWIYRDRLGQPVPSLDAVASGDWPAYRRLDDRKLQVARHGEN